MDRQNRGLREGKLPEKRDGQEEELARRRRQMMRIRQEKRRKRRIRVYSLLGAGAAVILVAGVGIAGLIGRGKERKSQETSAVSGQMNEEGQTLAEELMTEPETEPVTEPAAEPAAEKKQYSAKTTAETKTMNGEVFSNYGIFIDLETDTVLAERNSSAVINPASMTKILTILTAAEALGEERLDEAVTVSKEATEYSFVNECSNAGFEAGETVTVRDLFYGTILPSGGEAAAELAVFTSGSMEEFVSQMNRKAEELGLSDTAHFTNCAGLYDENHHCTVYDMAMILEAALDNPFCREVLSARTYTTSPTTEHPEGLLLSNWFLRRIEDKDTGGEVLSAKTGYVVQSGSCAASYGKSHSGKEFICVTADATSSWRCIYDHVALYQQFGDADSQMEQRAEETEIPEEEV
ncbi:MAG: D-alanyl-D-alanine carboxypeptidase family protein [Monoglobales bacterium]|jgi:D-alanyl-D-alanine carboxypeptidase (penicillin-binding protein 5/6)